VQPRGGYKTTTVVQICNVLAALDAGRVGLRGVRVYFAAIAMVAVREAAGRSREAKRGGEARGGRPPELACYRLRELARLSGLDEAEVRRQARRLARARLVRITERDIVVASEPVGEGGDLAESVCGRGRSPRRPVPIPRPILRLLARTKRASLAKTLLGYLVRGLCLDRRSGEVRGAGSAKLTWIADRFGLSERAARYARGELIALGVISPDPGSTQRKLNRDGAYFTVNLDWSDAPLRASTEAAVAPLVAPNAPRNAPPMRDRKTSYGTKDQETRPGRAAGLRGAQGGGDGAARRTSLRDIRREDLLRTSRVLELYDQATKAGWLVASEANRTNFVAAAARATRARGDAVRIFVAIVRRGLWHHITGEEEARAVAAVKRLERSTVRAGVLGGAGERLGASIASILSGLSRRNAA
jgi:hypothetical protein